MSFAEFCRVYSDHVLTTCGRELGSTQAADMIYRRAWSWFTAGQGTAQFCICWSLACTITT
jgi:hypothetical protein